MYTALQVFAWQAFAWLGRRLHRDEVGASVTEYVLLILGVVLFLIVAAFALQPMLVGAVLAITTWVGGIVPPPIPGP